MSIRPTAAFRAALELGHSPAMMLTVSQITRVLGSSKGASGRCPCCADPFVSNLDVSVEVLVDGHVRWECICSTCAHQFEARQRGEVPPAAPVQDAAARQPLPIVTEGVCCACGCRCEWRDVSGRWPLRCMHCGSGHIRVDGWERQRVTVQSDDSQTEAGVRPAFKRAWE